MHDGMEEPFGGSACPRPPVSRGSARRAGVWPARQQCTSNERVRYRKVHRHPSLRAHQTAMPK